MALCLHPSEGTLGQGGALTVVSAAEGGAPWAGQGPEWGSRNHRPVRLRHLVCGQGLGALLRAGGLIPAPAQREVGGT